MNSGARDKVNEWVKKDYNSEDDFSGNAQGTSSACQHCTNLYVHIILFKFHIVTLLFKKNLEKVEQFLFIVFEFIFFKNTLNLIFYILQYALQYIKPWWKPIETVLFKWGRKGHL